jgi:hypothetical protein
MRTRMSGGVGRAVSDGGPYPISHLRFIAILQFCDLVPRSSPVETQCSCQVTTEPFAWQVHWHRFGKASGRASALRVTALTAILALILW